jgi:hypothetical protein
MNCFDLECDESLVSVRDLMTGKQVMARNAWQCSGFIWADKVVMFAAGALLSLMAFCWLLAFLIIGGLGAKHLWKYMGVQSIELSVLIAVLILVVMRGVDFAMGGPTYQLFVPGKRCLNSIAAESQTPHR